jgi:hypothetical protein
MTQSLQPSDLYAPLTWDRLMALRKILWDTRTWVADDAKVDRGDDRTVIGYRAWAHGKFEIAKRAAKEFSEWLSVKHGGTNFTFKIAMMPIRFCRGDSEEGLPPKYAYLELGEEADIQEASKAAGVPFEGLLRIIIEADANGAPLTVHLVHADKVGKQIRAWEIPESFREGTVPFVEPKTPLTLGSLEDVVKTKKEIAAEKAAEEADDKAKPRGV